MNKFKDGSQALSHEVALLTTEVIVYHFLLIWFIHLAPSTKGLHLGSGRSFPPRCLLVSQWRGRMGSQFLFNASGGTA